MITTSAPRALAACSVSKATAPGSASGPVCDHVGFQPLSPGLQLVDSRGAEGVRGAEDHLLTLFLIKVCQLSDAGRLPYPVYTDHQDDQRAPLADFRPVAISGAKNGRHFVLEYGKDFVGVAGAFFSDPLPHAIQNDLSRGDAHVSRNQKLFKVVPKRLVYLGPTQQGCDSAEPRVASFLYGVGRLLFISGTQESQHRVFGKAGRSQSS